jgi:hypothetical protein
MSAVGAQRFVTGAVALFDKDLSTYTWDTYVACLQECDDRDLDGAMQRVVRRCRWFPSVAEILELVDEAREQRAEQERQSRPRLPEAPPDPAAARTGLVKAKQVLLSKGVLPRRSAADVDRPTLAELRHDVHVRHGPRIPDDCRLCRQLEDAS